MSWVKSIAAGVVLLQIDKGDAFKPGLHAAPHPLER